jgi:hypothetical protein
VVLLGDPREIRLLHRNAAQAAEDGPKK